MTNIQRWERLGRWFMAAGAVFAAPTLVAVLLSGLAPPQLAVGFSFLVFMGIWVWFWVRGLGTFRSELVALVGMVLLSIIFTFIEPSPADSVMVFVFVLAGVIFPPRRVGWVFAILLAIQIALAAIRLLDPATALNLLINSLFVGLVACGARFFWQSYVQLGAAREEIARLAISEERLRFSRDLHDLLGQSLAVVVLKSELVAKQLPEDVDDSLRQELRDVAGVARKSLNDVREAVAGYRRPSLTGEIANARTALRSAGIALTVEDQLGRVPHEQDAVLAWCVREGVANVLKHSEATHTRLHLTRDDDCYRLVLVDDGKGAASLEGGSGLNGLRERLELSGGRFQAGNAENGGFGLSAEVPAGMPAPSELAAT